MTIKLINKNIPVFSSEVYFILALFNKNLRTCENCGETIPLESKFCTNCGEKQKPVKIKEEKKVIKKDEVEVEKVCPECGEVCEPTVKFCNKCGHKF